MNRIFLALGLSIVAFALLSPLSHAADVFFPIVRTKVVTQTIVITQTASISSPLPDTGFHFFASGAANYAPRPQEGEDYFGQDAHYGHHMQQHFYTNNGDGAVTDNVTGLMWMQEGDGVRRNWQNAVDYCANLTSGSPLAAGYDDWRLPDYYELSFLMDRSYTGLDMTIDPIFDSHAGYYYWTSSPYAYDSGSYAWAGNFDLGTLHTPSKGTTEFVRCVRSGPAPSASYVDNGDGTVTDETSGLMWMQDTVDANKNTIVNGLDYATWKEALALCEESTHAGHSDWRLPNINELQSLVDTGRYNPAIDISVFSCLSSSTYWASTPCSAFSNRSWGVTFTGGGVDFDTKGSSLYVRCVRGGP